MNINEIKHVISHLKKTSTCPDCKKKYSNEDIHILATTGHEGLFEMKCAKCNSAVIANVAVGMAAQDLIEIDEINKLSRKHKQISQNDILDIRNFLGNFDGNFKKIFTRKK